MQGLLSICPCFLMVQQANTMCIFADCSALLYACLTPKSSPVAAACPVDLVGTIICLSFCSASDREKNPENVMEAWLGSLMGPIMQGADEDLPALEEEADEGSRMEEVD